MKRLLVKWNFAAAKRLVILSLLLLLIFINVSGQSKYQKDFLEFWTDYKDNYAYFDKQNIDWNKVKQIYQPVADTIHYDNDFIRLLEQITNEFHNGHVSLNINLKTSNRIIPSGSDVFVEKKGTAYILTDLRENFPAESCGLKIGMSIVKFNGKNIDEQIAKFLPRSANSYDDRMYQYAINMLFAGTHDKEREITVIGNGTERIFYPDKCKRGSSPEKLIEYQVLKNNTGYIKINNSLGNYDLIKEFDSVLDTLLDTRGLILDLTETPGGGNSTVARAIMGRFIEKELPYQKHIVDEKEFSTVRSWIEYVSPRGKTYKKNLVIMVGHWTGSMGEGMAIGFDGMKRGKIAGTKMAGLIGAINGFRTAETHIGYQIPIERLYHINGTPREDFIPGYLTQDSEKTRNLVMKLLKTGK